MTEGGGGGEGEEEEDFGTSSHVSWDYIKRKRRISRHLIRFMSSMKLELMVKTTERYKIPEEINKEIKVKRLYRQG